MCDGLWFDECMYNGCVVCPAPFSGILSYCGRKIANFRDSLAAITLAVFESRGLYVSSLHDLEVLNFEVYKFITLEFESCEF
jgi:hypothetical protein